MNPHTHHQGTQMYTCPMHPEVQSDKPGMCPECGMALVQSRKSKVHKVEGHPSLHEAMTDRHKGHSTNIFKIKFWVSLTLTIPVVLYSDIAETVLNINTPKFPGSEYLTLVLGSFVFFYGGWIFLVGAWREIKGRLPGMMTLIAIAIIAAYLFSVFEIFRGSPHNLFWELTTLITIMLLGHWLEMRAVQGAQGALKELAKLLPDTAEIIREGKTVIIPLSELREGDVVLVKPGSKIPADGVIIEGSSGINESMVTGESKPVEKDVNSKVIAGTINGDGSLKVKVEKIGEHTFLAGVMRLVAEAQASKSKLQMLSDRAALYLTVIAVVTGVVTLIAWLLARAGVVFATERLVAVLVIACPHALGLAVPLVASISTTMAARNGLLIKQRLALEAARKIDAVLFDKTGTLTTGEFGVDAIIPSRLLSPERSGAESKGDTMVTLRQAQGINSEDEVLQLAASVNQHSEHPIAKAIVAEAKKRQVALQEVKEFQRIAGKGARATVDNKEILVGSQTLLQENNVTADQLNNEKIKKLEQQGKTIIYTMTPDAVLGAIALADQIRQESREAVAALKHKGVKTAMITGDSEDVAKWVASQLKLDEYFARVLPHEKSEKVKALQQRGLKVAMVGDGVNDAPALTQADVGIAIGAGTNVAIESAGIILVRNDPRDIPKIIQLSQLTYAKMIQNLFWATGYNIVALPLAAGVLAFKGIVLQPALAALFMSLSTVIVAVNAMLLKRKNL